MRGPIYRPLHVPGRQRRGRWEQRAVQAQRDKGHRHAADEGHRPTQPRIGGGPPKRPATLGGSGRFDRVRQRFAPRAGIPMAGPAFPLDRRPRPVGCIRYDAGRGNGFGRSGRRAAERAATAAWWPGRRRRTSVLRPPPGGGPDGGRRTSVVAATARRWSGRESRLGAQSRRAISSSAFVGIPSRAPGRVTDRLAATTARRAAAGSGRPSASAAARAPLSVSPAPVASTASTRGAASSIGSPCAGTRIAP